MEATSNPTFKSGFNPFMRHLLKNDRNGKSNASTISLFLKGLCPLLLFNSQVVSQNSSQPSFPPLKNNSDSSSSTPLSKANLFASVFASNSNLDDQGFQPHYFSFQNLQCHPSRSSHEKSNKPFSSSTLMNQKT